MSLRFIAVKLLRSTELECKAYDIMYDSTLIIYYFSTNRSEERARFQQELRNMNELHEAKLQEYIYESETKHKMEMDEIDERKSNEIMKLIEEHDESFREMRNYYNDITQNNLTLIGSLKEQMEELKNQLEKSERQLNKVSCVEQRHFRMFPQFLVPIEIGNCREPQTDQAFARSGEWTDWLT